MPTIKKAIMKQFSLLLFFLVLSIISQTPEFDLTVVGPLIFADGIGRQSLGLIESLYQDVRINFIHSRIPFPALISPKTLAEIPTQIHSIIQDQTYGVGSVAILEDVLVYNNKKFYTKVPNSLIKIAYTMFEADALPPLWVSILNNHFDAAVVPDDYVNNMYKKSGVLIPIFVIPLGIYLDSFLEKPVVTKNNNPFTFGVSATLTERKNHILLINSFAKEFSHRTDVHLTLHARYADPKILKEVEELVQRLQLNNITILIKPLPWNEYVDFITSLDCYVLISKAEGFSITPREALAAGIPCILSNNTAHTTICNTGLVISVPSCQKELASRDDESPRYVFNCSEDDVRKALRDVYENHALYCSKALRGRLWAERYSYRNLKKYYLNLIKPKQLFLADRNEIGEDFLMTNCLSLYKKYKILTAE